MKVALGTIEVSDEARKAIRKLNGGKGDATRTEVKEYLLNAIDQDVIPNIGSEPADTRGEHERQQDENEEGVAAELAQAADEQHANEVDGAPHGTAPEPVSAEELPEVPGAGTAGGYTGGATAATGTSGVSGDGTTPSTGDLGSSGTPGGTA